MMSVIIRLQNLPWAANAADIRAYFKGLSIPEGGVHIVGGEQGDAFIAFSTDEDARQAMLLDGGKLKEVKIKLFLSSRAEMLRVIEQARQQTLTVHNIIHGTQPTNTVTPAPPKVEEREEEEQVKSKPDEEVQKDKKDKYRSPSRERGRSRVTESRDRTRRSDSRERSRGKRDRERDNRRRRDRSRSRDRHRNSRRSRSRDRRRSSRDRDRDDKDSYRSKRKESREGEDEKSVNAQGGGGGGGQEEMSESRTQPAPQKVPLLPDPPALPPMLQIHHNGKETVPPPAPMVNFADPERRHVPFPYNPQMGPMSSAYPMPMRGREGWPQPMPPMGVMDPMQMGMPRPMMNSVEMGMHGFPAAFGMNGPMFPAPQDPMMWRQPMLANPEEKKKDSEPGLCVEIRGLPLNVSYVELKKLFDGLSIPSDGIKMINDTQGNRTGIAYIRFNSPIHKSSALNQNGKKVRSNVVEVLHLRDSIYKTAIDNYRPDKEQAANNVVDMDIEDNADNAESNWARESKSKSRTKPNDPRMKSLANEDNVEVPGTDCVLLQGIPLHSNEGDILDFFSDLDLLPVQIHIVYDNLGQPVGDAFCLFGNFEDGEKALLKNNAKMERNTVSITRSRREEMERVRQLQQGGPSWQGPPHGGGQPHGGGPPRGGRPHLLMRGGHGKQQYGGRIPDPERYPYEERERDRGERMRDRGRERERYPEDRYPEDRYLEGRYPEERMLEERGGRYRGGENGMHPPLLVGRGERMEGRGMKGGMGGRGRGGMDHYRGGTRRPLLKDPSPFPPQEDPSLETFGRRGCVVAMENLHFRADIEEVIDFFEGFEVEHENIIRRFDDSGRPTGDARVAFKTPSEASRAVRAFNFKVLRGRPVKLTLI